MAMADAQTGQYRCSTKPRPVSRKQGESLQQRIVDEQRIHSQVFQESTNLGKRSDLPSASNLKGCKPTKKILTRKASHAHTLSQAGLLPAESISHRKPQALAEVSTQVSMQLEGNPRVQHEGQLSKKLQTNRVDFKEDIFTHLLATDVSVR